MEASYRLCELGISHGSRLSLRGVGLKKFAYDIWGDGKYCFTNGKFSSEPGKRRNISGRRKLLGRRPIQLRL